MQYQSSSFRTWHRWLSLIVGVQMVIWAVSGAYMVLVQLPFIHGVHLTQEADGEIQDNSLIERFPDIVQQYPEAEHMYLVNRLVQGEFRDLVQLETDGTSVLVDPHTRSQIEIGRDDIYQLASVYYAKGDPQISEVRYLKSEAPSELNERFLPIWQVNFDDVGNTSLYLHPQTGEMMVRRHDFWRGFDIMWMLHIMDYQDRVNITTWWLRAFIFATFAFVFTGTILLVQTIWLSRRQPG
ncbi:PepSY domain-containing protein [Pseudidiomarina mangrovi]|uniref:PepSY domain-containing protein n=1 Tax=Pseudidiomarina mangrovi TaxID=2487133 RepID=UPI000FCAF2EC|nr:PepSY domain-containing protein [Pseudidiomarina mangrovi]MCL5049197.1 PepSY domain-containing protein [Bacillota bacterium]